MRRPAGRMHSRRRSQHRWKCPMRPSDDLSRSLAPFTCDATAIAVVELSQKTWLVGGIIPGINRHREKKIAPDEQALLHRWRGEAGKAGPTVSRIDWPQDPAAEPRWSGSIRAENGHHNRLKSLCGATGMGLSDCQQRGGFGRSPRCRTPRPRRPPARRPGS
jgi:hypothetical protein